MPSVSLLGGSNMIDISFDLDREIELLGHIADWARDLRRQIWRAQIQFELIGLDPDETASPVPIAGSCRAAQARMSR
jgi:hypothetical protein